MLLKEVRLKGWLTLENVMARTGLILQVSYLKTLLQLLIYNIALADEIAD